MKISRINPNLVSLVEVSDTRKTGLRWYDEVKEERIFFGLMLIKEGWPEGFYPDKRGWLDSPLSGRDINWDRHVLGSDDFVYEKPKVSILTGNKEVTKYFDTFEEAYGFTLENFKSNTIKIEEE